MHGRPHSPGTELGWSAIRRVLFPLAIAGLGASCFDGADALGLPCRVDDDCGQGQSCVDGFCGGPPATTSATGSGSGSMEGSTTSDDTGGSSGGESSTGVPPGCGNGVVDEGEQCDPGTAADDAECDADCSLAECGDGYVNTMALEECDDGNGNAVDDCTPSCRLTLFWDDMEQGPMTMMKWNTAEPEHPPDEGEATGPFQLASGWQWGVPMTGVWQSGSYPDSSGSAQLITRDIEFPPTAGEGYEFQLRFRHRLRFDGNPEDIAGTPCMNPLNGDGGIVLLQDVEDGPMPPPRPAGPPMGHPDQLDDGGGCLANPSQPANPLYDEMMPRPVYTGIGPPMFVEVGFPLPDVEGRTVQLVFQVGYDCANCWQDQGAPNDAGWIIDDVVVAPFPVGMGG